MHERLDYLDKAKGILIVLMVIGHIFASGYINSVIYAFHMPAFFVISGILTAYTGTCERAYSKFIKSRIYSMVIPFIFFEVWACVTYIIRYGFTQNIFGFTYNTLTLNFNNGVLWFLFTLILVEFMFVTLKHIIRNDKVIIGICLVLMVISVFIPDTNNYLLYLARMCRFNLFFAAGYYGKNILLKYNRTALISTVAVVFIIVSVFGRMRFGYMYEYTVPLIVSSLCGSYAVIQIGRLNFGKYLNKLLLLAGVNTLVIFGTHNSYFVSFGNMLGITDFALTPIGKGILLVAIVLAAEVPTVYILNRFLPFLVGKKRIREKK